METIKDSEGNSHVIFDESSLYDDSQMGDNISDFEILQILSEKKNDQNALIDSFIAKVRSSKNHKIYAMKKIEFNQQNMQFNQQNMPYNQQNMPYNQQNMQYNQQNMPYNQQNMQFNQQNMQFNQQNMQFNQQNIQFMQNYFNEMRKLINLNNPHIIKYYKVFNDSDYNIFLIMEFMNNADITGYITAHQVLNKNIKEEEIWNILLQCLSALDYLHNQNLGNLGIQFCNIYMNNEQNAKVSVFNEYKFLNQNIDIKNEIYLLGLYFYIMCFSQDPRVINVPISQVNVIVQNNPNYSIELMKIIYWMVNQNPNERPYTNQLYNIVKQEYVKKYANNTSINAILRCLYSFPSLNNTMFKNEFQFTNNMDKYYINNWYLRAIKAISGIDQADLKVCVEEFRRAIASENSKLDGNQEIDPLYLLAFLLVKMHKEANKGGNNDIGQNQNGNYVNNSIFNAEEEDKTNKEQMLFKFVEYFTSNNHSPISDLFFGFIKTKRICQTCKTGYYSFSNFCFVVFDISNNDSNKEFNLINDGFKYQYYTEKTLEPDQPERAYCDRCLTFQRHVEFNRYFMMNHQLIISFIRGNNYQNYSNIIFDEYLNLEPYIDEKNASPKNYYLVGCINRIIKNGKENFIYFTRDPYNRNIWHNGDDELLTTDYVPINDIKKNGQIIMLFYNNMEIQNKNY